MDLGAMEFCRSVAFEITRVSADDVARVARRVRNKESSHRHLRLFFRRLH